MHVKIKILIAYHLLCDYLSFAYVCARTLRCYEAVSDLPLLLYLFLLQNNKPGAEQVYERVRRSTDPAVLALVPLVERGMKVRVSACVRACACVCAIVHMYLMINV